MSLGAAAPTREIVKVGLSASPALVADLDGFGRASADVTEPAEAAKPAETAKPAGTAKPARGAKAVEVARPVEVQKRIPGTLTNGPRSRIR